MPNNWHTGMRWVNPVEVDGIEYRDPRYCPWGAVGITIRPMFEEIEDLRTDCPWGDYWSADAMRWTPRDDHGTLPALRFPPEKMNHQPTQPSQ